MWKIKFERTPRPTKDKRLFDMLKIAVEAGGWSAAKEVCRNTKGKTASVLYTFIDEIVIRKTRY